MKKYSKKWLLKYEPYIVCENIHTRLLVSVILDRMGFKYIYNTASLSLAIDVFDDYTFTYVDRATVLIDLHEKCISAADFIAANPGKGGARIKTNYKAKTDLRRSYRVSISDNECKALTAKYGSLTKAIRTLLTAEKKS